MKKFYALIVVTLCFIAQGFAQVVDYTWAGGASGNWNNGANWTRSDMGAPAVPNNPNHNIIFNSATPVAVNLDISSEIYGLSVAGAGKITITSSVPLDITANSTDLTKRALIIESGSTLEINTTAQDGLIFIFGDDTKARIDGTWILSGADADHAAFFMLPEGAGQSTSIDFNNGGVLEVSETGGTFPNEQGDNYIHFRSGSTFNIKSDIPAVISADYHTNSTINITGVKIGGVTFDEAYSIGNLVYNCPDQEPSDAGDPVKTLDLKSDITVKGNLSILNTSNEELALLSPIDPVPGGSSVDTVKANILGNLTISGNSKVIMGNFMFENVPNVLNVRGNINMSGNSFSLRSDNQPLPFQPSILYVGGNINHTGGTFTANSNLESENFDLFVIEMNGNSPQTIDSHQSSFDNTANQVTLRINNPNGVTLNSILKVGKLSFATARKGNLNTSSTNYLTINNTSSEDITLNSPSAAGFVNGPLRRTFSGTTPVTFATGNGGAFRPVTIIPATATESVYEASYVNSNHPNSGSVQSPISGIAPYYWIVNKISGSDAVLELTIPGAVPGATADDALLAVKFDNTSWVSVKGATGTIAGGTATSGTIRSELLSSFSPFTIGYALNAALPINLISFTGKKSGTSSAQLNWKISDNSTPQVFGIMRSADGANFSQIGSVTAFNGKVNYDFTDNSIISGNNYYRLKMQDKDGTVSYSNVVVIMNGTNGVMISSMIPTMVYDRARLNISSSQKGNMQLVITDINGRIIQNQIASINSGNQEIWINASRLSAGMYQITGYINGEKTATIRFFKR